MKDSIGKLPHPKTKQDALTEIRQIATDKRGHVLMVDHCEWLELKLKAIAVMAKRGLAASKAVEKGEKV